MGEVATFRAAENRRVAGEQEAKADPEVSQREAKVNATDRAASEQNAIAPLMPIDSAKEKCASLGFAVGTEKFGSCVLQLTK